MASTEPSHGILARGALMTIAGHIASLARPVALAGFARAYGAASLGQAVVLWTCIDLGARLATWGLDRGLQRWTNERRPEAAITAILIAGISSVAVATAIIAALPRFVMIDDDALFATRAAVLLGLPITAMGNVALRAARGEKQIAMFVLARGVTEPLLLLIAGLLLISHRGAIALPAATIASIVGGGAMAAIAFVREVRGQHLDRRWPIRELLRTSMPLGLAELLQSVQAKLDLVAVALITFSTRAIAAYAVAAELAAVFTVIRTGVDQIVVPVATDLHGRNHEIVRLLVTASRWCAGIAVPVASVMIVLAPAWLELFGGGGTGAPILVALVIGRAVELALGPAMSVLAVIGRPELPLIDAAAGVMIALALDLIAGALGFGSLAVAVASALSVIVSSALAPYWLSRAEIGRALVRKS